MTPVAALLVTVSGLLFGLGTVVWQQRHVTRGARSFAVLSWTVAVWTLTYGLELAADDLASKVLWSKAQYLAVACTPSLWLVFVLYYTSREDVFTRRVGLVLAVEPLATLVLAATEGSHGLLWQEVYLDASGPIAMLAHRYGPWLWIHAGYSFLLMLMSIALLLDAFAAARNLVRHQVTVLLAAAVIPWVGNILYLAGVRPIPHLDLTPFAFALSLIVASAGLWLFRLLDIVPIARDAVVESMSDSLLVLDAQNRIVDVNRAAETLFRRQADDLIGQPVTQFAGDRKDLVEAYLDIPETEGEFALGPERFRQWYSLQISPLWDQ